MKCKECNVEYEAKRSTSKYCSAKCRKLAFQNNDLEVSVPSQRLSIPGDTDYVGCCKEVDGDWVVDNTKPPIKDMDDDELLRRLYFIYDWKHSEEHGEILRRRAVA